MPKAGNGITFSDGSCRAFQITAQWRYGTAGGKILVVLSIGVDVDSSFPHVWREADRLIMC